MATPRTGQPYEEVGATPLFHSLITIQAPFGRTPHRGNRALQHQQPGSAWSLHYLPVRTSGIE